MGLGLGLEKEGDGRSMGYLCFVSFSFPGEPLLYGLSAEHASHCKVEMNVDCGIVQEIGTTSMTKIQNQALLILLLLGQIKFSCHAVEQLEFHPFSSLWTLKNTTYHVRARRKIVFEYRLPSALHIDENSLPEMPT